MRIESADSIVSSFSIVACEANNDGHFRNANPREMENRKSRFARMLSRSMLTGLFDNVEKNMEHAFKRGDRVAIFNSTLGGKPIFEGYATVLRKLDTDHYYRVKFKKARSGSGDDGEYDRFAFPGEQQTNPDGYLDRLQAEFEKLRQPQYAANATISKVIINKQTGKMQNDQVFKLVGFDPNGIRRVRGCDYTEGGAREQCMQQAMEYVRGRPDTGPLDRWRFEWR